MTINWNTIWMNLFGKTELFGINMGFWAAITVTGLIVILMNVVFGHGKDFIHTETVYSY